MVEDYIEQEQETGQSFTVSLHLKVQKVLSVIMYSVSKQFYLHTNNPHISLLTVEELKTILKHKRF